MKKHTFLSAVAIVAAAAGTLPLFGSEALASVPMLHSQNVIALGKSQAVGFADLDLGHKAGAKVLLARIGLAAGQVCGPEPSVDLDRSYRKCVTESMTRAVQDVGQPLVSSLFQDKFGVKIDTVAAGTSPAGVTAATH